jgi:hypothetical protein
MSFLKSSTPVEVTRHAVAQYKQRLRDGRPNPEIHDAIVREVRAAIGNGRFADRKRPPFKLFKERKKGLLPHQRFVWAEDEHAAWIIALEEDRCVVVTTLSPAGRVRTYA